MLKRGMAHLAGVGAFQGGHVHPVVVNELQGQGIGGGPRYQKDVAVLQIAVRDVCGP